MPPAAPGIHRTGPPRRSGGNLDCRELVVGSILYLPIEVPGGLFSVGDGHAARGDGEVSGTCPMDRVELTLSLVEDMRLRAPMGETPDAWLTLGLGQDLDDAYEVALNGMLDLMCERLDCTRKQAMALASIAAHPE